MAGRIERIEHAIADTARAGPPPMRTVIDALQAWRGVAEMSAVTLVADVGTLTRLTTARPLMGESGAVPREDSGGAPTRRGARYTSVQEQWCYIYST